MNDIQKKWTLDKCNALLIAADDCSLPQETADLINEMVNKYYVQAKGNEEVKAALLATHQYIERMYKILKGN